VSLDLSKYSTADLARVESQIKRFENSELGQLWMDLVNFVRAPSLKSANATVDSANMGAVNRSKGWLDFYDCVVSNGLGLRPLIEERRKQIASEIALEEAKRLKEQAS